jgi:hypothetical protein
MPRTISAGAQRQQAEEQQRQHCTGLRLKPD